MLGRISAVLGQASAEARTATSDGTGLGTIESEGGLIQQIAVTSAAAANIIILPPPVVGKIVMLLAANATGYELRSSDPATIGINGGTGAAVESAIPASSTVLLICESLTAWKGLQMHGTGGTLSLVEVAA